MWKSLMIWQGKQKFEKNTPFGEYFTYKKFVSASQTIHLDYVNDTFRLQKQYVYEFQIIRLLDFVELTLIEKSI